LILLIKKELQIQSTYVISDPFVLCFCASDLLQEGLKVRGLPLAAGPELHPLVKDWDAGVMRARPERRFATVALKCNCKFNIIGPSAKLTL